MGGIFLLWGSQIPTNVLILKICKYEMVWSTKKILVIFWSSPLVGKLWRRGPLTGKAPLFAPLMWWLRIELVAGKRRKWRPFTPRGQFLRTLKWCNYAPNILLWWVRKYFSENNISNVVMKIKLLVFYVYT
jgi:hypothetical protein